MRILVFGKNGQVARCLQDEAGGADIVALGSADCNLMIEGAGAAAIAMHAPDIIVNAAAYTAVDKAETDRDAAFRLNVRAPTEIAAAAKSVGARFIHLSTDYVFNGASNAPYREDDQPSPLGVYGATKRDGEIAILETDPRTIIIRTSWVFSEYGENFVKTMLRLAKTRNELTVVADQLGGPTAARDIARAVLTISAKIYRGAAGEGIYHFQGAPAVSWASLAETIFELANANVCITPIETKDYPTAAQRPLRTVLDCGRMERDFGILQPDWRLELENALGRLGNSASNI